MRDQPCAECGVEENRHVEVEGCSGFRPLPAPGDDLIRRVRALRAEADNLGRAARPNNAYEWVVREIDAMLAAVAKP